MSAIADLLPYIDAYQPAIKEAKERQRLTNAQLVECSGVSASAVNKLLAGTQVEPKLYNTVAICKVLGLSLDQLFGLDENPGDTETLNAHLRELELENEHFKTVSSIQAEQIKETRATSIVLVALCTILAIALAAYLVIDTNIRDAGLIRLGDPTVFAWVLIGLLLLAVAAIVLTIVKMFGKISAKNDSTPVSG